MRQGNYSVLKWCSGKPMSMKPVVIVTGASRGLGAAVARWLAKSGAAVTLVARSEEKLNRLPITGGSKSAGNWSPRKFRPAPLPGWHYMRPGNSAASFWITTIPVSVDRHWKCSGRHLFDCGFRNIKFFTFVSKLPVSER
jgi:hypothetical protein